MKEINFSLLFIIAVSLVMVNPGDAVCIDNKVTVYTNVRDAVITLQTPILFDTDKKILGEGQTWDIDSDYTLTVQSINFKSSPHTATLVFKKNGAILDKKVVSAGETYTYASIFSAKLDGVFAGQEINVVFFKYIYFLSEPYLWKEPQSGTTSMKYGDQWYWESNYIYFSKENRWKVSYGGKDGYLKPENETQTADGRNCIEFRGLYSGGNITITSNIAEASFTISGPGGYSKNGSGTSWYDDNVMSGSYTVTFMDVSGYTNPGIQKRNVTPGNVTYFSAYYPTIPTPIAPPETGSISISSIPLGASIYLDGNYIGTTPKTIEKVEPGSRFIILNITGYKDWSQTIVVAAGKISTVSAPLTQIPTTGSIPDIIIVISGISAAIVIFYIVKKLMAPKPAPLPEERFGIDTGKGYHEKKEAAVPPIVGKEEEIPVLLAVSAPEVVKPGDIFTARLAAYIKSLEEEVKEELIKLSRGRSESYMGVESCRWKLDTRVTTKLSGKHLNVDPPETEFVWKGERNLVNFSVEVLADAPEEWTVLRYEVFIEGVRVAFIPLDLEITSSIKSYKRNIATIEPAHTAFASYASQDRLRVLDRVAAVRISAGLDIFMDCLSIHPGEEWKRRLEYEIEKRDLFLLFWSANAKNSEWVTWEWKTALVRKGESAIQLHPLQSSTEAPPPEELRKFHFGDFYMIVRNA